MEIQLVDTQTVTLETINTNHLKDIYLIEHQIIYGT